MTLCIILKYMTNTKESAVSGVYAILGPNGVYVGESTDCWGRNTLDLAVRLGLDCGIIRETPKLTTFQRRLIESSISGLFRSRGMKIVSRHGPFGVADKREPVNTTELYLKATGILVLDGLSITEQISAIAKYCNRSERTIKRWRHLAGVSRPHKNSAKLSKSTKANKLTRNSAIVTAL